MKQSKDQIFNLIEILSERGFEFHKNGTVKYNGRRCPSPSLNLSKTLKPKDIQAIFGNEGLSEYVANENAFINSILETIEDRLIDDAAARRGEIEYEKASTKENRDIFGDWVDRLVPVFNPLEPDTSKAILLIDKKSRRIETNVNLDYVLSAKGISRKDILYGGDSTIGPVIFDPTRIDFMFKKLGRDTGWTYINSFKPPEWQKLPCPENPEIPPIINELLNHLFPVKEELEMVLDWFHHAMTSRCQSALVLAGAKGVGKSLLLDHVMKGVMGKDYCQILGQGTVDGHFNAQLENMRLVVLEEISLKTDEAVNNIKRWLNDHNVIEKKGVDAFEVKNHSSLAICSNDITSLRILNDDRRYSIPQVTNKMLRDADFYSFDKIDDFVKDISNETERGLEYLRQFGFFLLKRKPKISAHDAIKGRYYYYICYQSAPLWVGRLREALLAQYHQIQQVLELDKIDIEEFGEIPSIKRTDLANDIAKEGNLFEKMPAKIEKLAEVISQYKIKNKYPLCEVLKIKDAQHRVRIHFQADWETLELLNQEREEMENSGFAQRTVDEDSLLNTRDSVADKITEEDSEGEL